MLLERYESVIHAVWAGARRRNGRGAANGCRFGLPI